MWSFYETNCCRAGVGAAAIPRGSLSILALQIHVLSWNWRCAAVKAWGILGPGSTMSNSHTRAGRSTGPKTPAGKAKASQNSTKHGCCSNTAVIKGEIQEDFDELTADWMEDYRPRSKSDQWMVEAAAQAQWVQMRNTNRYQELEQKLQEKSALDWTEEDHKEMERFTRYRTTAERFIRARGEHGGAGDEATKETDRGANSGTAGSGGS
jgi:hypothetical protein